LAVSSGRGENPGTALDVAHDCGEADLQTDFRQSSPSHAPKTVAALPRSKDLLDAAANAVDRLIPSLKARNVSASSRPHMPVLHYCLPQEFPQLNQPPGRVRNLDFRFVKRSVFGRSRFIGAKYIVHNGHVLLARPAAPISQSIYYLSVKGYSAAREKSV
jgi:hypothetical protein